MAPTSKRTEDNEEDFLDELMREYAAENPDFPAMVDAAYASRRLARDLTRRRERLGLTQEAIAERIGTTQSAISRLEAGGPNTRINTLERYAHAVGAELVLRKRTSKLGS